MPVLLLHGAYMTTGDFGPLLPGLAATRRVVVCDPQGHGRTGDADRPLTYEGMADDAAASSHTWASPWPTSSATAWAAVSRCSSPSGTRSSSARSCRSRPATAATPCSPSCSR